MKHRTYQLLLAIIAFTFFTPSLYAENKQSSAYLSFAVGHAAILDTNIDDLLAFKVEYRAAKRLKWGLIPSVSLAYAQNDANFVAISLEKEYSLTHNWKINPIFGLGVFNEGKGLHLGNDLEFRSGLKFYYQLRKKTRLGFELYHLSNGGLSDRNPGTEPVFVSLSIPF